MVEGARLESVYRGNSIAGSNPAPSASLASDQRSAAGRGLLEPTTSMPHASPTRGMGNDFGPFREIFHQRTPRGSCAQPRNVTLGMVFRFGLGRASLKHVRKQHRFGRPK